MKGKVKTKDLSNERANDQIAVTLSESVEGQMINNDDHNFTE